MWREDTGTGLFSFLCTCYPDAQDKVSAYDRTTVVMQTVRSTWEEWEEKNFSKSFVKIQQWNLRDNVSRNAGISFLYQPADRCNAQLAGFKFLQTYSALLRSVQILHRRLQIFCKHRLILKMRDGKQRVCFWPSRSEQCRGASKYLDYLDLLHAVTKRSLTKALRRGWLSAEFLLFVVLSSVVSSKLNGLGHFTITNTNFKTRLREEEYSAEV